MKTIKDLRNKVCEILKDHPETRDCDKRLLAHFWHRHERWLLVKVDDEWYMPLKHLKQSTSQEAVARVRRKIQNDEGWYLPLSLKVAKKRGISEEKWRWWASQGNDTL